MARTRWPPGPVTSRPLPRPGRSDRQRRWVPENLGPGRQVVIKTARAASADSEVRPGPRPPTLRPQQRKPTEAGPGALPHILPADLVRGGSRAAARVVSRRSSAYGYLRCRGCLRLRTRRSGQVISASAGPSLAGTPGDGLRFGLAAWYCAVWSGICSAFALRFDPELGRWRSG